MTPFQYFEPLLEQSLLYPGQSEAYRGQCVQSVMLWLRDTGTEPPIYPSAFMYYTRGVPGYTKIPVGSPILDGDIVVYGSAFPVTQGNGHIDVATGNGTPGDYWAYDQNWTPLIVSKTHHNGSDNQYIMGYLRKGDMTKEQAQQLSLYARLMDFESVDEANSHSDDDVNHILADPGYAGALLKQLYNGSNWQSANQKKVAYEKGQVAPTTVVIDGTNYVPKG